MPGTQPAAASAARFECAGRSSRSSGHRKGLDGAVFDRQPDQTIGAMLPHTLGRDACPMKRPAGSVYYEFRIRGLRGDMLLGGYDRVGLQFRVIEFGVDVTRPPLPQLQSRPRQKVRSSTISEVLP
jgi:hypothetical protein